MGTSTTIMLAISLIASLAFMSVSAFGEDSFLMQAELKGKKNQFSDKTLVFGIHLIRNADCDVDCPKIRSLVSYN
jgi:hypothetical protein